MRDTAEVLVVPVEGSIVVKGSGIISSGVDSKGDVDVETPPKPFIKLLVNVKDAADVERASMLFPFVRGVSEDKNFNLFVENFNKILLVS